MSELPKSLGRIAAEAWSAHQGGDRDWQATPTKGCWEAAAQAVVDAIKKGD